MIPILIIPIALFQITYSVPTTDLNKCEKPAICVPFVQCPAHVQNVPTTPCTTLAHRPGLCCSTGQNHTGSTHEKFRQHWSHIDDQTLRQMARRSREEVANLRSKEAKLLSRSSSSREKYHSNILMPGSAEYGHFRNSRLFNMADLSEVMSVASKALEIALATRAFKDRQGITAQQLELGMVQENLRPTPLGYTCPSVPLCSLEPEKYRRIDGSCNNLANAAWGHLMTPYARLLPPSYQDGIWQPRVSYASSQPLSSPRKISSTLFSDVDAPNTAYTAMVMQFGQFLSHDITQSIDISFANGSAVSCCTEDGTAELAADERHYSCFPIVIPADDPFYHRFNQRCMNFVRSVLAPRKDCTLGSAQQMNKITHFLDASSIYGSVPQQTFELRSFEGGKLKVFKDFGRDLLPLTDDTEACLTQEQGSACFRSGDTRTNQMISLVVLHTIFMREHNRIASELSKINRHWDDERLFLETRQIIMAELQVITYKEFLPALIGESAMDEFQLRLGYRNEYAEDYDCYVEPSVTNEFAAAAFRFGHSIVDGLLKMYGMSKMDEMISIPEVMFQPGRMRKQPFLDECLSALTTEPIQDVDRHFSETLTQYLFRAGNPFGIDLASLNIQRGRDHGLRPYNDYRQLVGLAKLQHFQEFGDAALAHQLQSVYESVDDVDLWVGGLLEPKAPGSLVGYTFRDIIADQFYRLKKGDRYFFENSPKINPGHFTPGQLGELRKASMSRIVCDNSDKIFMARQAKNAFLQPGVAGNEFADCDGDVIPHVNLLQWKEEE